MSTPQTFTLPESWKFPLIIAACITVVYLQALRFDFVTYDDNFLITDNTEFLKSTSNIIKAFGTHAFTSQKEAVSVYYRPVLIVSYIIDYQLWRINPIGYHLMNIIYHCAAGIFLFLLLKRMMENEFAALFASIIFALHPVQTEAVAWIAGRNDVLLGLFIIMMMYFYKLQHDEPEKQQLYYWASIVSFTLALFTKESAAFYILLLPLFDIVIRKIPFKEILLKENLIRYASAFGILLIYFIIRLAIFGQFIGAEKLYGKRSTILERFAQAPGMFTEHIKMFLLPINLSVTHPMSQMPWFTVPGNIFALLITGALLFSIVWMWKRDTLITFGLLWVTIGLIPVLNLIPLAVPMLEHRLYAVAPGFALVLCRGIYLLLGEAKLKEYKIGLSIIVAIVAILSLLRLPVWRNSESLFNDAIAKGPTSARSYFNLAGYYFDQKQYEKTIEIVNKYLELEPKDFFAYGKLRDSYLFLGKYLEATNVSKKMIEFNPKKPDWYIETGQMYQQLGMYDSAAIIYTQGIREDSTMYQLHLRLGALLEDYGKNAPLAARYYQEAIRQEPQFGPAYFRLGRLLTINGDTLNGIATFEEGIKNWLPPQEVISYLKNLYELTGQHDRVALLDQKIAEYHPQQPAQK